MRSWTPGTIGAPCVACDTPIATRGFGRWCSGACRNWSRFHPGEKRTPWRKCKNCVAIFPFEGKKQFCSLLCKDLAYGGRVYGPRGSVIECAVCGVRKAVEFGPGVPGGHATKCCSPECRRAWQEGKSRDWRHENPERFRERERRRGATPERKAYQRAAYQRRRAERMAPLWATAATEVSRAWLALPAPPVVEERAGPRCAVACVPQRRFVGGFCLECDQSFVACPDRGDRFCSLICGKRYARRERRGRQSARFVEPVFRQRVFERDGWRCQLPDCGKLVKRDAVVPHPKAPTIDHIVPLALGGEHSMANVQTAHFLCNSQKRELAMNEQLRLVG